LNGRFAHSGEPQVSTRGSGFNHILFSTERTQVVPTLVTHSPVCRSVQFVDRFDVDDRVVPGGTRSIVLRRLPTVETVGYSVPSLPGLNDKIPAGFSLKNPSQRCSSDFETKVPLVLLTTLAAKAPPVTPIHANPTVFHRSISPITISSEPTIDGISAIRTP
jgi:hypothetical protein